MPSNLFQKAKQGNPKAIALLLNEKLNPKGMDSRIDRRERTLRIFLEGAQLYKPDKLFSWLRKQMVALKPGGIERVTIRGLATGKHKTLWTQGFQFERLSPTSSGRQPSLSISKILVASARPHTTKPDELERETAKIKQAVQKTPQGKDIIVEKLPAIFYEDLTLAIAHQQPNLIHFCGADALEGLIFASETQDAQLLDPGQLVQLFEQFGRSVKCVILDRCLSVLQADAISDCIRATIAIDADMGAEAANLFTTEFYRWIGYGEGINEAFEMGSLALQAERVKLTDGLPQPLVPQLIVKNQSTQESEVPPSAESSPLAAAISHLEQEISRDVIKLRKQRQSIIQSSNIEENIQWLEELRRVYSLALGSIASNIGTWLEAERTTIYFVNEDRDRLWSIFAQTSGATPVNRISPTETLRERQGNAHQDTNKQQQPPPNPSQERRNKQPTFEISVSMGAGVSGRVAEMGRSLRISYPAREHEHSREIRKQEARTGFKTHTLLTIPLKNEEREVFAVIQFINKLRKPTEETNPPLDPQEPDAEKYSRLGFTQEDENKFLQLVSSSTILRMLESIQTYYNLTQHLKGSVKSTKAARAISQSSNEFSEALQQIMNAAKEMLDADRSTLWILDFSKQQLWTEIPTEDGGVREAYLKVGQGFAGQVAKQAQKGNYRPLNIPFDVYEQVGSATAKQFDLENDYRTCSLLCMPVLGYDESSPQRKKLIGVTQLVNKTREGFRKPPAGYVDDAPECFEISFGKDDERRMEAFNAQAAMVLQNARQFSELENYEILYSSLKNMSEVARISLGAKTARVYLFDTKIDKLWTILPERKDQSTSFRRIEYSLEDDNAIALVARWQKSKYVHIPSTIPNAEYDRSSVFFPVSDRRGKLIAVVEASRKLMRGYNFLEANAKSPLALYKGGKEETDNPQPTSGATGAIAPSEMPRERQRERIRQGNAHQDPNNPQQRTDYRGFVHADIDNFYRTSDSFFHFFQGCMSFCQMFQVQQNASALMKAQHWVLNASRENSAEEVMKAARELVNADRCTLWRFDRDDETLVSEGYVGNKGLQLIQIPPLPIGAGYAGLAAEYALNSRDRRDERAKILKVDFDLYNDTARSAMAMRSDKETRYRTCSLLCMPIFNQENDLMGILQLVNKKKSGYPLEYHYPDPATVKGDPPEVPDGFRASFSDRDVRQLEEFNRIVGTLIFEEIMFDEIRKKAEGDEGEGF
ncbi:MAG: GAF domain-containing protein [Cyanobacteria bacterium SBLK]|nr:GAF domain-containing protein [Cyanobacteria bacterium SBLK]